MEPHTWGVPGGKMEPGETPEETAVRELREELSYHGELLLVPSFVYREPNFNFFNFIALVPDEFESQLNWENDDARWFAQSKLPKPLHFGVDALLKAAKGQIAEALKECSSFDRW
jgi:8-oxo-dGTP pyrophosphatase MutT (NUDIX family)